MEIAIIQSFAPLHYEVWLTDQVETGTGMGDVFDTHSEAMVYAEESELPVLDISAVIAPVLEGNELRNFMSQYLELSLTGEILAMKTEI